MNTFPEIDARGLSCPQPVMLTKKALEQQNGRAVVLVDDPMVLENVRLFAQRKGLPVSVEEEGDTFRICIGGQD